MTINKVYSVMNFLLLMCEFSDTNNSIFKQSPDYIIGKFEQYFNNINKFEFPINEYTNSEIKYIEMYEKVWGTINDNDVLRNILVFNYNATWKVGALPSYQLKIFKKYIGDYNKIKEPFDRYMGLHQLLIKDFYGKVEYQDKFKQDMVKLKRELSIESILDGQ